MITLIEQLKLLNFKWIMLLLHKTKCFKSTNTEIWFVNGSETSTSPLQLRMYSNINIISDVSLYIALENTTSEMAMERDYLTPELLFFIRYIVFKSELFYAYLAWFQVFQPYFSHAQANFSICPHASVVCSVNPLCPVWFSSLKWHVQVQAVLALPFLNKTQQAWVNTLRAD